MDITAFYIDERNALTQPDKLVFVSQYFRSRWMPRLGPTGTAIVLFLRGACYHNRKSGETRDTVQVPQKEIAAGCGCSVATLKREMENNAALGRFVQVDRELERDGRTGHLRQLENQYRVAMDDPLTDEDEAELRRRVDERVAREAAKESAPPGEAPRQRIRVRPAPPPPGAQNELSAIPMGSGVENPPVAHFEPPVIQMGTPGAHFEPPAPVAQNELALKDLESSLLTESFKTTQRTLNVVEEGRKAPFLSRQEAERVEQVITLTGDGKSRKRYVQLARIVAEAGCEELWRTAFAATEARLHKSSAPVENPGAYFCGTLARLLGAAGVYVPVGDAEERADVRAQIAASLFGAEDEGLGRFEARRGAERGQGDAKCTKAPRGAGRGLRSPENGILAAASASGDDRV